MRKKQTLKTEVEKTIKLLMTTLGVIIVVLMVIFLFTTSKSAELGYKLQQVRTLNDQLKDLSQDLKTQVTNVSTSKEIENNQKIKEMTAQDNSSIEYLLPKDNN